MTRPQTPRSILILQSVLIFLQICNVAAGHELPLFPGGQVILSALIGALQFYLQSLGNAAPPPPKKLKYEE